MFRKAPPSRNDALRFDAGHSGPSGEAHATGALYFAYGSNMHWDQLRRRCSTARFVGCARLDNHRPDCTRRSPARDCGVLDIVPDAGHLVWGGLFKIELGEFSTLDASEAVYSGGYQRIRIAVTLDESPRTGGPSRLDAFAYQVVRKAPAFIPPSREYLHLVLQGAGQCGLPESYIGRLASFPTA